MKRFSIDESGYTGYDLLHKTQPWQGACAVSINDDDARYLIKQHFPRLKTSELKFSSLKRRDGNKKPIFSLLQDLLTNFPCVTCVANKRFMLALMFIDYAVEPYYYDNGINFYEDGCNVAMASSVYYLGSGFDIILQKFQDAMHYKTSATVDSLIESILAVDWKPFSVVLIPLALRHPDCIEAIITPQTSTDAAFPILQALISSYRADVERVI